MNHQDTVVTERIRQMEDRLNHASAVLEKFQQILEPFEEVQEEIRVLSEYYGSAEWRQDFEDWEKQKLPAELRCGVLSEDLIYDLLADNKDLAIEMLETASKILKENKNEKGD